MPVNKTCDEIKPKNRTPKLVSWGSRSDRELLTQTTRFNVTNAAVVKVKHPKACLVWPHKVVVLGWYGNIERFICFPVMIVHNVDRELSL